MVIIYNKREFESSSLEEIAWTASYSNIERCLVYNGKEKFISRNHVQSVIKFGIDIVPAKPDEVPDAVRLHAESNMHRLDDE